MTRVINYLMMAGAFCALADLSRSAKADALISTFDSNYFENALYASWAAPAAIVNYGPDSYSVTATGYGSNWTYIGGLGVQGAGNTHLKLDVTLEGPPAADGHLGPIVTLVDSDGTRNNYAWFGQLLGSHALTLPVTSPSWVEAPGSTAGLNLNAIDHMHLQIDPGGFGTSGAYTVKWNELSLITVAATPGDYDGNNLVDGNDLLRWQRGNSPTPSSVTDLNNWKTHYGPGALTSTVAAVPEPAAIQLLILASVSGWGMSRRRVAQAVA